MKAAIAGVLLCLGASLVACRNPLDKKKIDELLSTAGAGTSEAKPPPKTPPNLSITWVKGDFTIPQMNIKGSAHSSKLGYYVHMEKLPPGTKIELGSAPVGGAAPTASDYGDFTGDYDLAEQYGQLGPKDALNYEFKFDPKAKAHVTFPDGATFDIPLPADSVKFGIEEELKKVKDGHGVLFGKEPDGAPKEHSILNVDDIMGEVLGPATKMTEIDWIGIETKHPPRDAKKTCSGYKGTNEATERTLPLVYVDATAEIYERKTGKLVDKKDFTAETECPMMAMGDKAEAWVNGEEVKNWYRQRRQQK